MTGALMGIVAGAASGESLFKRSTFLTDFEGKAIASPLVTITDDADACRASSVRARSTARA